MNNCEKHHPCTVHELRELPLVNVLRVASETVCCKPASCSHRPCITMLDTTPVSKVSVLSWNGRPSVPVNLEGSCERKLDPPILARPSSDSVLHKPH